MSRDKKFRSSLSIRAKVMSAILGKAEKSNHTNIFICCLGNDSNGHKMLQNFKYHHFSNVDKHVRIMDNVSSGLANVMVETTTGNNRIIIVAGANALLSPEHIDQSWDDVVLHCNVIVCQLETSVSVALHAFRKATEKSSRKIITSMFHTKYCLLFFKKTMHLCNCATSFKYCSGAKEPSR